METRELVILAIFALVVVAAGLLARRIPVHPAAHAGPAPTDGTRGAAPAHTSQRRVSESGHVQIPPNAGAPRASRRAQQPGASS